MKHIKVLSYNIHKGFNMGNRKFVLDQMRKAIHDVGPDLVFLQEVIGAHRDHRKNIASWPKTGQYTFLADGRFPHVAYGRNAVYDAGHHGNAILSAFPLATWENQDISTNRLEQRGMLHGELNIPRLGTKLHVITLHLNLLKRGRLSQVEDLCQRIEDKVPGDAPLIISGDFNDWSVKVTEILIQRLGVHEAHYGLHGDHARTFPSIMPMLKLDRIYCRGLDPLHAESLTGAPWRELSDHTAYYAELGFTDKQIA